jgi:hypothetical protein
MHIYQFKAIIQHTLTLREAMRDQNTIGTSKLLQGYMIIAMVWLSGKANILDLLGPRFDSRPRQPIKMPLPHIKKHLALGTPYSVAVKD